MKHFANAMALGALVLGGAVFFCPTGALADKTPSCPVGYAPSAQGCIACPPGKFAAAGAATCSPCPVDTFSATAGAGSCTPCPEGKSTRGATGAMACVTQCEGGTKRVNGSCVACSAGTFSNTADASTCSACAKGSFSSSGASSCTQCAPGTFADKDGSSSCAPCPAGTFAAGVGAVACSACPAGTTSPAGATSCTKKKKK